MYLNIIFMLGLMKGVLSANILMMTLVPSHSHHLFNSKYLQALLNKGHNVTYLGVEKMKNAGPNVRHITFDKLAQTVMGDVNQADYTDVSPLENILLLDTWDHAVANYVKKSETFQQFLNLIRKESFDLVVYDIALAAFVLGAVDVLKYPPVIGITAFGRPSWIMDQLESPVSYVSDPHSFLSYTNEMTFFQRLSNFLFYMISRGTRALYFIEQNKHAKDAYGDDIRPLEEIFSNMNIIMVNSIEGVDYPYPRVPGLIPIGGLHIEQTKPLPKDLQLYLDGAKHGAIYFSLGTFVSSSRLPREKVEILNKAFTQLAPMKILWKWETDDLPGKPDNVKIVKWAPQNDVLAHPNVRLFFTHSGLLSTQEAIYHGVPILGMPFVLDQMVNINKCVKRGIAESLNYQTVTTDAIVGKVRKILNDPKYRDNIKGLSRIFRDRMTSPLEKAVFWSEYAMRHNGAGHLSLSAKKLAWYQNALLDIYLFILFVIFVAFFIVYKILRCIGAHFKNDDAKVKRS